MNTIFRTAFKTAALAMGFLSTGGGGAMAQTTVVVELFTSQGCSSCPAADAMLTELRGKPGILPLTLNVDYWDYMVARITGGPLPIAMSCANGARRGGGRAIRR